MARTRLHDLPEIGYKVISVIPENEDQIEDFTQIASVRRLELEVWGVPKLNQELSVLVPPESLSRFLMELSASNINYYIKVDNLESLIDQEARGNEMKKMAKMLFSSPQQYIVNTYARHDEINNYLDMMVEQYSPLASIFTVGTSHEGRLMKGIKIGGQSSGNKPAIWIDAGIHAREWIAPATAVYIINELLSSYESNELVQSMVDTFDWYILPVVNPDGYEYSHTTDRLWRKNRSGDDADCNCDVNNDRKCRKRAPCCGTDLNRNFGYMWDPPVVASDNKCESIFRGRAAFSEIEAANVRDFLSDPTRNFQVYVTLHSYGQQWLLTWGYTTDVRPDDYDDQMRVATIGANALKATNGLDFWEVGTSGDLLYSTSGASDDWAKGGAGIKYAFTLELRPSSDRVGFVLPPDQIDESGSEMFAAMMAVAEEVAKET
ncbi:carboxypeptidase B [Lingula anatina]|uniref:Carboxypeptidase B n=1 Tax=Lingula anatina TaxID=7574 RepID=A0A2R2MR82_LINAN|nr:carboxypeptidase B [Lingula anatina]|eukprot:XP_023932755.1 carboxypeptidase B [Lingula anatina]